MMGSLRSRFLPLIAFLPIACLACSSTRPSVSASPGGRSSAVEYFSPRGGAIEAIVREIGHARNEILVQAYPFASAPLAEALVEARKRGVNVTVILDRGQRSAKYGSADLLNRSGIRIYVDDKHPIANNRIMIIDGSTAITGSFHSTKAANEDSAENLLVIRGDTVLIKRYLERFEEHRRHSLLTHFE